MFIYRFYGTIFRYILKIIKRVRNILNIVRFLKYRFLYNWVLYKFDFGKDILADLNIEKYIVKL